ncbi:MAG: beta-lactamase family protein, partial [Odoribacter sp.]|nr:beta-lactamase family protein [Odoribacter sp.]
GASFGLMKDNKLWYAIGYGYADFEQQIPTETRHIFRIASISKLITAAGIMKLAEDGRLHLDDPVFGPMGILNDSIFSSIRDPRTKQITVEHLLRHKGGFTTVYGDPMFCSVDIARKMDVPPPADLNTIIRFVLSRRLRYVPGTSTAYSNVGYGILSKVIEKVSGTTYENYIQENILRPAGCFDMHLANNLYEDRHENEVRYYETADEELIPACDGSKQLVPKYYGGNHIEALSGAGAWVASPIELLRFLAVIDGEPRIKDILKPETIAQMTAFSFDTLPIGWMHVFYNGDCSRTGTLSGTSALLKKQHNGYSWAFVTNTSSWKGSKFPSYINQMINRALSTVKQWPEKDLFELQSFEQHEYLVERW